MKKIFILFLMMISIISFSSCKNVSNDENGNVETLENGDLIIMDTAATISLPVYDFDTFNPILTKSSTVVQSMRIVYEPLFNFDKSFNPIGVLASGYSVSSDGLKFTVNLKNDIKWSDGSSFTSADVHYTFKTIKNNSSLFNKNLDDVIGYNVLDTYTYIITLKRPVPNFIGSLNFPIIKNGTSTTIDSNYIPLGTGPYKYLEKLSTNKVSLACNEIYHGGLANIKNVFIQILKDKESSVYAFEVNEIQCITSKIVDLNKYTPKGTVSTKEYTSNDLTFLGMNFYNSVLWGESTRQAVAYMIDKNEIVNNNLYGRGLVVETPVNPSAWFYDKRDMQYDKDLQYAESLMNIDGWVKNEYGQYIRDFNGINQLCKLELLTNSESEEKSAIAYTIAKELNDAGMAVNIKSVSYKEYVSLIEQKKFDIFIGETTLNGSMDITPLVGSGGNYFTYVSSQMDSLINQMGKTQNKEEYKQLYVQFTDLFNKDMPFVPLYFRTDSLIYDSKLLGDIDPNVYNVYRNINSWYSHQKQ